MVTLFLTPSRAGAALFAAFLGASALAADARPRPNILFMMADDHTSQAWGCYGGRLSGFAKTPHIDRIAREGARLANGFCTNAICVPSRASILTGQYSHLTGVKTLRDALDPARDNVAIRLRAAGYQTALVGKWHLKTAPSGFDYWNIIRGQGRYQDPVMHEMDLENGVAQTGKYSADAFGDAALAWLEARDPDQPFALMLHFKATHEPFQWPPRHKDLYADAVFPEPDTLFGNTGPKNGRAPGWPLEILTQRMTSRPLHGGARLELSAKDPREVRRATYQKLIGDVLRAGAAIDDNVGRMLAYLDERGLARDTVVIYTSDQGYFLGEHNYFDKRFMLEESLRMPFVVRYPGEIPPGSTVEAIILNIDFAPLFLDYARAPIPDAMQGRSFRGHLRGAAPDDWRSAMYYRYWENSEPRPAHYGVRTRARKLIYYDGLRDKPEDQRWEYYDLVEDPQETINAYDAPQNAAAIAELKRLLEMEQSKVGDAP